MKKRFCTFCESETDEMHCEICGKRTVINKKYVPEEKERDRTMLSHETRYKPMEENHAFKEIERRKQQFYKNRKKKQEMSFGTEMTMTTVVGILIVLAALFFSIIIGA